MGRCERLVSFGKLTVQLKEWGFTINPFDSCTATKMVNRKQLTVVWHVDDFKISHMETKVVDTFIVQYQKSLETSRLSAFPEARYITTLVCRWISVLQVNS
jgi:hypothetical protein